MNAKKLVVAALSASMILTATPAFAKEETKTVKYTAEQEYIIGLLEQTVAADKVTVANAKKAVEDAEKAAASDAKVKAAADNVKAHQYLVDVAEADLKDYLDGLDKGLQDLLKNYSKKSGDIKELNEAVKKAEAEADKAFVADAKAKAKNTPTGDNLTDENKLKDVAEGVNDKTPAEVIKLIDANDESVKTLTIEQIGKVRAAKVIADARIAEAKEKADAAEALTKANEALAKAKQAVTDAKEVNSTFPKALQDEIEKQYKGVHVWEYTLKVDAVKKAKEDLAKAQAELVVATEGSEAGKKLVAAKEALKVAEANLAKHEKELADVKAGEGNKELVVEGTNGKKQVPNTADAE